MMHGQQNVKYS